MTDSPSQPEKTQGLRLDLRANEPGKNLKRQILHAKAVAENICFSSDKQMLMTLGYSESTARNPKTVMKGKSFARLLEEFLPDHEILSEHESLLKSRRLDHMTFPANIEDEVIDELLADVNCVLRKVVHGTQAKHAYFWSPDNRARKDGLDMIYKLKGKYAPEKFEDVSPYKDLSTTELMERKKKALDFFKKRKS